MRNAVRFGIAVMVAWLTGPWFAHAGVYISSETRANDYRLGPIKLLRGTLQSLALPARPNDSERQLYEKLKAELEAKEKAGSLTEVDRADLGGLYVRFGRPREAVRVLSAGSSSQFLVLCNLAVANHDLAVQDLNVNLLEEAILAQRKALANWPATWTPWSDEQAYLYRRVEKLELRLLELRFRELRLAEGRQPVWQTVDDLFPGFKMTGSGGTYEAGRTAPASFDALPPDAPWLVRELMMAYPTDPRLYWLFGEILNSCGRAEDAQQVLDDLVNVNQLSNVRELVAHRRVLVEQAGLIRELRPTQLFHVDGQQGVTTLAVEQLFWSLAPRVGPGTPVGGPAMAEASWWATAGTVEELQRQERLGRPPALPELPAAADPAPSAGPAAPASALPDWRTLAVGFGVGVAVTIAVGLQRVEWKRRRQAAVARKQAVG